MKYTTKAAAAREARIRNRTVPGHKAVKSKYFDIETYERLLIEVDPHSAEQGAWLDCWMIALTRPIRFF